MNILLVDNYDSFTFNLVSLFKSLGANVDLVYNTVSPNTIDISQYDLLVLSPGPSHPIEAGYLMNYIDQFYYQIPILGICLGFQAIVLKFEGELGYLSHPVHGKSSIIKHNKSVIFNGISEEFEAGRYHSIYAKKVSEDFTISADFYGIPMAIEHNYLPIFAFQFHPESILTMKNSVGKTLIKNVFEKIKKESYAKII